MSRSLFSVAAVQRLTANATELAMRNIKTILLTLIIASTAVFACSASAFALTANSWTTPRAYTGQCPATMQFEGMLSGGNPGAAVQYTFFYVNPVTNHGVNIGPLNGVLDNTGTLQITVPVAFGTGNQGASSVILYGRQGGGPLIHSTATAFSVACTSSAPVPPPTPPPPSAPQGPIPAVAFLSIGPPNVSQTTVATDCVRHVSSLGSLFAGVACKTALSQGKIILVWDWSPLNPCPRYRVCPPPDGYHIYAISPASRTYARVGSTGGVTLVGAQTSDVTLYTPPSGSCYVVMAYVNRTNQTPVESGASNMICAGASAPVALQHLSFQTAHIRSGYECEGNGFNINGIPGCSEVGSQGGCHDSACRGLEVGYAYFDTKDITGDRWGNLIYRSAVLFDVSSINGRNIIRAQLLMPAEPAGDKNCTNRIGEGYRDWWNDPGDGWIDDNPFYDPIAPAIQGNTEIFDVTGAVRSWSRGLTNNGFVLENSDENLKAFTNKRCYETYSPYAQLVIDFQ